jgi:hypothetical protein
LGQASSGPDQMFGPGPAPKKERKKVCWADIGPLFLGLCLAQSSGPAQPTCFNNIYLIYNIILYISFKKNKKFQKNFKNPLKKIVIFSNIFFTNFA